MRIQTLLISVLVAATVILSNAGAATVGGAASSMIDDLRPLRSQKFQQNGLDLEAKVYALPAATAGLLLLANRSGNPVAVAVQAPDFGSRRTRLVPESAVSLACDAGDRFDLLFDRAADEPQTQSLTASCGEWIVVVSDAPASPFSGTARVDSKAIFTTAASKSSAQESTQNQGAEQTGSSPSSRTAGVRPKTGDIVFSGPVSYTVSGSSVNLQASQICNQRSGGTSGTLFLEMFMTTGSSPVGSGFETAVARLGELSGGFCFNNISQTVSFSPPPPGTYFVHFLVSEFPDSESGLFSDSVTFDQTFTSGGGGDGGGSGAGDIAFTGAVGYTISGSSVNLRADQICNQRSGGTSGTLFLKLFMTTGSSPSGTGFVTAEARIGELTGGFCFNDISQTVAFDAPPQGSYFVHLLVAEFPDSENGIFIDSVTFDDRFTAGGGGDGAGEVGFTAPVGYTVSGSSVTLRADQICNERSGGASGTLFLRMFLTSGSSPEGSGFMAAEARLGELSGGFCFNNISQTVPYSAPPPGTYFVHFLIAEFPDSQNGIFIDSITFEDRFTSSGGGGVGGGGGGDDDGGGGGGPMSGLGVLGLALLLSLIGRRRSRPT